MKLDDTSAGFLAKRRRFARTWPWVGTSLLLVLGAFVAWMFVRNPLLINPLEVASLLEAGTLEESTLILMAGMLPIMLWLCLLILSIVIAFGFVMFSNERKYHRIIDKLLRS
jgi:hypothetical protein